jgi:hypothetical protein
MVAMKRFPAPVPGSIAARLEEVRLARRIPHVQAFHAALGETGYRISYEAVRTYHAGRVPPVEYLVAVSRRFAVTVDWLATGVGPSESAGEPDAAHPLAAVLIGIEEQLRRIADRMETEPVCDRLDHVRYEREVRA